MLLGIICFIFACGGIYGFYNDVYILTYIGFGLCLFENVLGRIDGSSKTLQFFLISCLIGWIVVKDFWLGISIGACFENIISFVGGVIMIIIGSKIFKSEETNKTSDLSSENVNDILKETKTKAKKDLESAITREELKEMLDKGYITQETYIDTLHKIELLETIAKLDIDK